MGTRRELLSWARAVAVAAAFMAAVLGFAIPVNLALGRVIHWDIVSGLGLAGLVAFTFLNRPR